MQDIIKKYSIHAKKSLGQNFLMNEEILNQMAHIFDIEWHNIIEVWPWFWALTQKILLKKPKKLTLVELDTDMVKILKDRIDTWDFHTDTSTELSLLHQDVLKMQVLDNNYFVIANIPYYITSPILQKFLYQWVNPPEKMLILMQKEVGERIISKVSSVLSLFVQKKCTVYQEILVWRENFSPAPKVDSVVLSFHIHHMYDDMDDDVFLAFIKQAFSNPRKKMLNNLSQFWYPKEQMSDILSSMGFSQNTRAEELSVDDFIRLISFLKKGVENKLT